METMNILRELAQEAKGKRRESAGKVTGNNQETPYKRQLQFAIRYLSDLKDEKKRLEKSYHSMREWNVVQIESEIRKTNDRIRYLTRKMAEKEI